MSSDARIGAATDRNEKTEAASGHKTLSWHDLYSDKVKEQRSNSTSVSDSQALPKRMEIFPLDWGIHANYASSVVVASKPDLQSNKGGSFINVERGDSLSHLAKKYLGDARKWPEIYDLNKDSIGEHANVLQIGTQLKLPDSTIDSVKLNETAPSSTNVNAAIVKAEQVNKTSSEHLLTSRIDPSTYFMTQFLDQKWNPYGPTKSNDCGPASVAMAVLRYGKEFPGGNPTNHASLIAAARRYANASGSTCTNLDDLTASAQAAGLHVEAVNGMSAIDRALENGKSIVLVGNPRKSFESSLGSAAYGNSGGGDHIVLVVEQTADGKYVVCDSLSRTGPLTLSRQQLKDYSDRVSSGNTPGAGLALSA